jgi:hypothetical protein
MPPDSVSRRVLADTNLLEVVDFVSSELRNLCAELIQKRRWVVGRLDFPPRVIVAQTERNDAAIPNVTVTFERFQWQSAKVCREFFLFPAR